MELGSLQATQSFLSLLGSCQAELQESHLLAQLNEALSIDGYTLQRTTQELSHRFLRGLAEAEAAPSGKVDIVAVFMVILCIVCAGFASGLTQVRTHPKHFLLLQSICYNYFFFCIGTFVVGHYGNGDQVSKWFPGRKEVCGCSHSHNNKASLALGDAHVVECLCHGSNADLLGGAGAGVRRYYHFGYARSVRR